MRTVWIYERGEDMKVFTTMEAAQAWFEENDPEGVAFEHTVQEQRPAGTADQYGVPKATE